MSVQCNIIHISHFFTMEVQICFIGKSAEITISLEPRDNILANRNIWTNIYMDYNALPILDFSMATMLLLGKYILIAVHSTNGHEPCIRYMMCEL